ncbi:MAG: hypothetical protein GC160_01540 [Acidobacteria bacterium]|nr:hypothetical protein [Acidobacteriota bacterium]
MSLHRFASLARLTLLLAALGGPTLAQDQNVILVSTDGLRWQDLFRGADPGLLSRDDAGMKDAAAVRERFGGAPEVSRRKIFPFLWGTVARQGLLYGNRDKGSVAKVNNGMRFSYPGYAELLTGRPHDDVIRSNDMRPSPAPTVLEIARRELSLERNQAAAFGSWEVFQGICARDSNSVFINAGYQPLASGRWSPRLAELADLQFQMLTPWRSARHDYLTFELALEYLRQVGPRALYIALDETDDWAHASRYDRVLEMAHNLDANLQRLWELVQRDPRYRGKTTLIVATDHGRGRTPTDWQRHGKDVEGADEVWYVAIGPHVEALGEVSGGPAVTQSDIAPTMLQLLGLDPKLLAGAVGSPIAAITGSR